MTYIDSICTGRGLAVALSDKLLLDSGYLFNSIDFSAGGAQATKNNIIDTNVQIFLMLSLISCRTTKDGPNNFYVNNIS